MTNADRLRAMTDEEMARFLDSVQKFNIYPDAKYGDCGFDCEQVSCASCWHDWLKQEVNDGD